MTKRWYRMWQQRILGNNAKKKGRLPGRTVLSIETLEDRAVPASIDFANLRFDYDGKLPAPVNGQYQIRTPVTVQLPPQGSNPVRNLMRFDGGVNLPVDASKTDAFSSVGDVWSLAGGGTALRLFDVGATDTRAFDSSDLLGTTNNKLGTKFESVTGIQKLKAVGQDFTFSTLRVDDLQSKSPALLAKGDFNINFGLFGNWDIPLPSGSDTANPYVRIHNGAAGLGANVSFAVPGKSFTRNNWTFTLGKTDAFPSQTPITFSYSTAAANRIDISGDIRIQNDLVFDNKNGVQASLGNSSNAGLQFTAGRLTRFDMSLTNQSAFTIKGLTFAPQNLQIVYKEVENKAAPVGGTITTDQIVEFSGDAKITKDGNGFFAGIKEIGIYLGTRATNTAKATPGIVITNGALTSLSAGLTIDRLNFGPTVSMTELQLGLAYLPEKSYYAITGGANLNLGGLTGSDSTSTKFSISLGSVRDAQPGIIIENGSVKRFDLAVTSNAEFQVKKLTISPRAFRFAYEEANDGTRTFSGYGSVGLKFSLANKPVIIDVTLGDSAAEANGFVVKNGVLESLQAKVSASFSLFGNQVDAQNLSVSYIRDTMPSMPGEQSQFVLNGEAGLSRGQTFSLQTKFGSPERNGLVIEEGALQDLYIVTTGSFNLRGLNVTADGLTIGYNRDTQTVFMSGGIKVRLGSTISFGASITGAGLSFNTDTGDFQIATADDGTPLVIEGNFSVAGFLGFEASFKYQKTPTGLVIAGSADVNVAKKFKAKAEFAIVNGELASIGLSVRTRIALGATGMFITEMNGSVTNLNNIDQLEVAGGVTLEHGAKVGGATLLNIRGDFAVNRDRLKLSGSVDFLKGILPSGGSLASGRGSVDLNWTLGVYKIDASLSIYHDAIKFTGLLEFDSLGNINVFATASLSFPSNWDWIGGYEIASGGFALQIRPNGGKEDSYVAAWGTFLGFIPAGFRYTINTGSFTLDSNPPKLTPLPPTIPDPSFSDYEFRNNNFVREDLWKSRKNARFDTVNLHFTAPFFANAENTWLDDKIIIPNAFLGSDAGDLNTARQEYSIRQLDWRYADGDRTKGIIISMRERDESGNRYVANDGMYIYRSRSARNGLSMKTTISYRAPRIDGVGTNTSEMPIELPLDGFTFRSRVFTTERRDGADVPITVAFFAIPKGGSIHSPSNVLLARLSPGDGGPLEKKGEGHYELNYHWNNPYDPAFQRSSMEVFMVVEVNGFTRATTGSNTWKFTPVNYSPVVTVPPLVSLDENNNSNPFSLQVIQPRDSDLLGAYTGVDLRLNSNLFVWVPQGRIRLSDGTTLRPGQNLSFGFPKSIGLDEVNSYLSNIRFEGQDTDPALYTLTITVHRDGPNGVVFSDTETVTLVQPNVNLTIKTNASANTNSPMFPKPSDEITFTVQASNPAGPNAISATDIEVNAALPATMQFVSATIPANRGSYLPSSGIWKINQLGVGETLTMTVVARVQHGVVPGDALVLSAQATSPELNIDAIREFDSARLTIGLGNPLRLAEVTMPDGGLGSPYFQEAPAFMPGATGAGGPFTYFIHSGSLPSGLMLDAATGSISGTPYSPGTFNFKLDVADRIGNSALSNGRSPRTYSITIPEFNLTRGTNSRITDKADPFSTYWSYRIGSGSLPPGMRLGTSGADNGVIFGAPTVAGTYRFRLNWNGWLGAFPNFKDYVVRVTATPGTILLANNTPVTDIKIPTGVPLTGSAAISFFGSTAPNSTQRITTPLTYFAVNLPAGLSLSRAGVLTGTPLVVETNHYSRIYAMDTSGVRAMREFTFKIHAGTLATNGTLPVATSGQGYSAQIPIGGGDLGMLQFEPISLPKGLSLSAGGLLSGIPTDQGSSKPMTVSFQVSNNGKNAKQLTLPLSILAAPKISGAQITNGVINTPFSQQFGSSGGSGKGYTWSWSGNLPIGWNLNPTTGLLSGKTQYQGRYPVNISVTDSAGAKSTSSFTFIVGNAAFPAGATSRFNLEPDGTALTFNAGKADWMQLTSKGELSGTPVNTGVQLFSLREVRSGKLFIRQYRVVIDNQPTTTLQTSQGILADLKILPMQSAVVGNTYKMQSSTSFTQPANGTVSFNSTTNTFRFTPRGNFVGNDSFTYTLRGTSGVTSTVTVAVGVNGLLIAPGGNILAPSGQATPLSNDQAIQLFTPAWGQGHLQVTLAITRGTLGLPTNRDVRVTSTGIRATLTGPVESVNAALRGLTYTPASGFTGNMALSVQVEQPRTNNTPLRANSSVTLTTLNSTGRTLHSINAGGGTIGTFTADANFSGGNDATISSFIEIDTAGVANAAPADAYRSERWGEFTYTLGNLQGGRSYTVRLDFVEIAGFVNQVGMRVFDVAINGTKVLSNFDIFAAAGAQYRLVRREFTATANSSGRIVIAFTQGTAKLDYPKISTISVIE